MIDLGPHAVFIIWAYIGVIVLTVLLIGSVVMQSRQVAAKLKALEAQGIRRRSSGPAT